MQDVQVSQSPSRHPDAIAHRCSQAGTRDARAYARSWATWPTNPCSAFSITCHIAAPIYFPIACHIAAPICKRSHHALTTSVHEPRHAGHDGVALNVVALDVSARDGGRPRARHSRASACGPASICGRHKTLPAHCPVDGGYRQGPI